MPVIFIPESCEWSPDSITGPDTERIDRAIDTDLPDGGASNGSFHRRRVGEQAGTVLAGTLFAIANVELPPMTPLQAAIALWQAGP